MRKFRLSHYVSMRAGVIVRLAPLSYFGAADVVAAGVTNGKIIPWAPFRRVDSRFLFRVISP